MNKVVQSASDAVADITSGSTLAVGGFGLCGIPDAVDRRHARVMPPTWRCTPTTAESTTTGWESLLSAGRIRRVTASYVGENKEFARQYLSGELEVELTPQGTLAEKLRAGGAGIPAFFTPAGVGTPVAEGGLPWRYHADGNVAVASPPKETRFQTATGGPTCSRNRSSPTSPWCAPGRATGRQSGVPLRAHELQPAGRDGGRVTIARGRALVEPGELDPDAVHLPGRVRAAGRAFTPEQAATSGSRGERSAEAVSA